MPKETNTSSKKKGLIRKDRLFQRPTENYGELIEEFSRYGFIDKVGHPLTKCYPFICIARRYCGLPIDDDLTGSD